MANDYLSDYLTDLPDLSAYGYGAEDMPGGGFDFYSLPANRSLFRQPGSSSSILDSSFHTKVFKGLFGGDEPSLPRWQKTANREFAQGRALLAAYNALYEPTLDLTRRSAADYGDLYRRASNEALSHNILAARTKRASELSDFQTLGPGYIEALRGS